MSESATMTDDWTDVDPTDAACIAAANLGRLADLGAAVVAALLEDRWELTDTPMRVSGAAGRNYD